LSGVNGASLHSVILAVAGAVLVLIANHSLRAA
jgi:hypothetical protein